MSFPFFSLKNHRLVFSVFISVITVIGIAALIIFLISPSEPGNRFLGGLSKVRLMTGGIFALLVAGCGALASMAVLGIGRKWGNRIERLLASPRWLFLWMTALYLVGLGSLTILIIGKLPLTSSFAILEPVVNRFGILLAWMLAATFLLAVLLVLLFPTIICRKDFLSPFKRALWFIVFLGNYMVALENYQAATYKLALRKFAPPLIVLGLLVLLWGGLMEWLPENRFKRTTGQVMWVVMIFTFTFVSYQHITLWLEWVYTPAKAYWDQLAWEILQGRLYLENPSTTFDLTFKNGHWFVPNPPLAALLMLPYVLIVHYENTSTILFSIFFSAVNVVLLFLILDDLTHKGWIKLNRSGVVWLTILFAFGSSHLWVGMNGLVGRVAQVVTVTFAALAVFLALRGWSPWLVGACLGLAIWSRPNVITIWPVLAGITAQVMVDRFGKIQRARLLSWAVASAVPLFLAIVGLLAYNWLRFGNFLDFGYATINGNKQVVENVQKYGMFNLHFILYNLKVMFFKLPTWKPGSRWPVFPSHEGMSLFLATPALVYLFRRYEPKWWVLGAWTAVLVSVGSLVMYHNSGSAQFGYRYLLDFSVPLWMLLAAALGQKAPWHFKALVLVSILIQVYGTHWFWNN